MKTIYAQDWSTENHGWTTEASRAEGPTTPTRIQVAHPLAQWCMQFVGNGGWAIAAKEPPVTSGIIEIRFLAYICSSGRNSLSLNVRDRSGGAIYKYSLGESNAVWANKQPQSGGEPHQKRTSLVYACHKPYELISRHVIGSGEFTLSLCDPIAGTVWNDPTVWTCRSKAAPAQIDMDQEGGTAVAYLGKVEVIEL